MTEPARTPEEDVRHLPVLSSVPEARTLPARAEQMPLSTPMAAATGGFLAGVGAFVLMRVLRGGARRGLRLGRRRKVRGFEVTGSKSFLVDVHMINRR